MMSPIALVTDFGLSDWYAGVMKGVILSINPSAVVVDGTHAVPPQFIEAAGFVLLASCGYLPGGSVVVVVVDPGVGGRRRILCASSAGRRYVFPDNGVLTELLDRDGLEKLVAVENRDWFLEPVSATFHGRDIFAPVAAHLSLGRPIDELGPPVADFERIAVPLPEFGENAARVRIRWIDRFGNLITDCPEGMVGEMLARWGGVAIDLGSRGTAGLVDAYESVGRGCPVGIIGSSGYLEVSIRDGDAALALGLALGDTINLRRP
jgi:S-adenosylmethionine hydrolase